MDECHAERQLNASQTNSKKLGISETRIISKEHNGYLAGTPDKVDTARNLLVLGRVLTQIHQAPVARGWDCNNIRFATITQTTDYIETNKS